VIRGEAARRRGTTKLTKLTKGNTALLVPFLVLLVSLVVDVFFAADAA
jgi:hypothetical protein